MKKTKERLQGRWFFLLLLCLLWGGMTTANAQKKAWVKYDDSAKTLTFYYSDKGDLGENEYEMNTDSNTPGWSSQTSQVTKVVFDESFAEAHPTTCCQWFFGGKNITSIEGIQYLNTSEVKDMSEMFGECRALTNLNLSSFNTQKVTNMSDMFYDCPKLAALDLSSFDTQNVTNMSNMFYHCAALTNLDLSSFDTQKVTHMCSMFNYCLKLVTLDLSNFNTQKVTNMDSMFSSCKALTNLDLASFDTQKVTNMRYMFSYCKALTEICASDKFTTDEVSESYAMFEGCTSLIGYDATKTDKTYATITNGYLTDMQKYVRPWVKYADGTLTFQHSYKKTVSNDNGEYELNTVDNAGTSSKPGWSNVIGNITKVVFDESFAQARPTTCNQWFIGGNNIRSIEGIQYMNTSEVTDMTSMFSGCSALTELDLSSFDTQNVKNMSTMFDGCSKITKLNLSSFNTQNVTDMNSLFYGCSALTNLNLSSFNTQNVTDMTYMFYGCSALTKLDLSKFNTQKVTTMYSMFNNCSALTELDLSSFDTKKVTNMNSMFDGCSNITKLDLSSFNTQNVTKISCMFRSCSALTMLDLSAFDTQKVTNMSFMFSGCSALTMLDLSSFDTQEVTNMSVMFRDCSALTKLDLSSFDTKNVTDMSQMFRGCSALTKLDLSTFNTSKVKSMNNMFYSCEKLEALYLGPEFKKTVDNNVIDNSSVVVYSQPVEYETNKADFSNCTVKPYVPINAQSEYGTICVPLGSKLTADSYTGFDKLYHVTAADTDKCTVTLEEATSIEPGVAYVYHRALAADADKSIITFEADDDATAATAPANNGNLLKGTFERITAPGRSYILQTDGNFHPVAADNTTLNVGAYRAYLDLGQSLQAQSLRFVFSDTTGISNVNTGSANLPKAYFDLSGRKVTNPQRGDIYIYNGRKIIY